MHLHLFLTPNSRSVLRAGVSLNIHSFINSDKFASFTGIIELVTESETLRKIQVSYGVTGSFKDRTIKEWLQKHNPTELEYLKVLLIIMPHPHSHPHPYPHHPCVRNLLLPFTSYPNSKCYISKFAFHLVLYSLSQRLWYVLSCL